MSSNPRRLHWRPTLGIFIFLLVIFLSACTGGLDKPDSFPAGYTAVEGDRVGLALPERWTSSRPKPEDFRAMADQFRETNPALAAHIDEMSREIQDDTLRLVAYHQDGITTMNVAAERTYQSLEAQTQANQGGLETAGYRIIDESKVTINSHDASRLVAEITINQLDGTTLTMALVQYTLTAGGRSYSISFGTPAYALEDFEEEFQQVANTFYTVD
jgi:hypothetical protein